MRLRGFEIIEKYNYDGSGVRLPERSTKGSAGYDFFVAEDVEIPSMLIEIAKSNAKKILTGEESSVKPFIVWTGIKSYMREDEVLKIYNRSGNPKRGLILANSVGIIDSDYYNNESNEGEIGFAFYNISPRAVKLSKGDKIGQGVFQSFLKSDNDCASVDRVGGFGSTGV